MKQESISVNDVFFFFMIDENLPASGNVFAFIQKQKNEEDRISQDGFKYLCLIRELISKYVCY